MSPFEYFALIIVQVLLLVAAFNVPLVVTWASQVPCTPPIGTCTPYGSTSVFTGIASLFIIFDTGLLIWKVR